MEMDLDLELYLLSGLRHVLFVCPVAYLTTLPLLYDITAEAVFLMSFSILLHLYLASSIHRHVEPY
jgi:hypothetical protein